MGNRNLKERIRDFIGHIGWKLFIWADWRGNEEAYLKALEEDFKFNKQ